jgi:hypothetical protein
LKAWKPEAIMEYDSVLAARLPGYDLFFVASAAAFAGVSEATFRNYLARDGTLGFIKRLPEGEIATVSTSVCAWRSQRNAARKISAPRYSFDGGFACTSGGSSNLR